MARLLEVCVRGRSWPSPDGIDDGLIRAGLVESTSSGIRALPSGREVAATWARLPADSPAHAVARQVAARLDAFSAEEQRAVTLWQRRGTALKDRLDGEDHRLVEQIRSLQDAVSVLLIPLGEFLPRSAAYPSRLKEALDRVEAGQHSYVAGLLVDSFHTIWRQLLRDLAFTVDTRDPVEQEISL